MSIRASVASQCPTAPAIYLDLDRANQHILALFLSDRRLKADWHGDDYIEQHLPPARVQELSEKGDCFIETVAEHPDDSGTVIGKLRVGVYQSNSVWKIVSIDNAYDREGDAGGWWIWVKKRSDVSHGFHRHSRRTNGSENKSSESGFLLLRRSPSKSWIWRDVSKRLRLPCKLANKM